MQPRSLISIKMLKYLSTAVAMKMLMQFIISDENNV